MMEQEERNHRQGLVLALIFFIVTIAAVSLVPQPEPSNKIMVKSIDLKEFNDGTLITLVVSNTTDRDMRIEGGKVFVRTKEGMVEGTLRSAVIPAGGIETVKIYVPGVRAKDITALDIAGHTLHIEESFKSEEEINRSVVNRSVVERSCTDECSPAGASCQNGKYFICEDIDFDGCFEKVSIDPDKDAEACRCGGFYWNGNMCCGDDKGEYTPDQCGVGKYFDKETCQCKDVWLRGWKYRRIVKTNGSLVKIVLERAGLEGKIKEDCSDIYLTDTNGEKVPFWIERCDNKIVIWARPGKEASLLMFYGNPLADRSDSGKEVFDIFDDFDTFRGWKVEEGEICGDRNYQKEIEVTAAGSGKVLQISLRDNDGECPAWVKITRAMKGDCLEWTSASPLSGDYTYGFTEEGIVADNISLTIRQTSTAVYALIRDGDIVKQLYFRCNPFAFNKYKICYNKVCCNDECKELNMPRPIQSKIVLGVVNRGGFTTTLLVDRVFSYSDEPSDYIIGTEKDVEHAD